MKTKLVIVIDTEENWMSGKLESPSVSNVYEVKALQEKIFDPLNIKPTYLITYPVATNPELAELFKELVQKGVCEVGTHVHNWTSPPFTDEDVINLTYHTSISYDLEKQKISDLTEIIKKNVGIVPVSFKGGRWGTNSRTIKILEELNYKVDTSVCPLTDFTEDGNGPNFFSAPADPYFPSPENILEVAEGADINNAVLELPVTIGFGRKGFEVQRKWLAFLMDKAWVKKFHVIGVLYRLNFLRKLKLSQEKSTFMEMKQLVDVALEEKRQLLYLTFHSNNLEVGASPYSNTQEEIDQRLDHLYNILDYIVNVKKIESLTTEEYRDYYIKNT